MDSSPKTTARRVFLLAVTGASGSLYARRLMEKAAALPETDLWVIFTETAKEVWRHETGKPWPGENNLYKGTTGQTNGRIHFTENNDFRFKYASGSNRLDCMIILPCSMGTLGRIAGGISADLIGRIADVQLKEKRPLLLVPREAPYNLIHLRNMTALCEAGATIIPASPSFYSRPHSLEDLIDLFTERLLETAGFGSGEERFRWNP